MPFTTAARPYTKENIYSLSKGQIGVYGIYKTLGWIYVGRGDIRARMLDHFDGNNTCITNANPGGWYAEVTANSEAREKQLIEELKPSCNEKVS